MSPRAAARLLPLCALALVLAATAGAAPLQRHCARRLLQKDLAPSLAAISLGLGRHLYMHAEPSGPTAARVIPAPLSIWSAWDALRVAFSVAVEWQFRIAEDDPLLVAPEGEDTPQQVHVSLHGPDAIIFVWHTGRGRMLSEVAENHAPSTASSIVLYRYSKEEEYRESARGSVETYAVVDYESGLIHKVVLSNLTGGETMHYRVGDPGRGPGALSAEFAFRIPRGTGGAGLRAYPHSLGMIADVGQTRNSTDTLTHLAVRMQIKLPNACSQPDSNQAHAPDVTFLWGDLPYADDYRFFERTGYQPRWDTWGRLLQPYFANSLLQTAGGNHELETNPDGRQWVSYLARYPMPYKQSGSDNPLYYSVNVNGVHVVALNVYIDVSAGSAQAAWLRRDLAVVNRTATPFVLAGWHAPFYNSNHEQYPNAKNLQAGMEDILYQYGVDAVFTGHVHSYERTLPLYRGQVDPCGPTYLIIGDAGNEEGKELDFYRKGTRAWSAFRSQSFGHGIVTFNDADSFTWTWYANQAGSPVDHDTVTVTRPPRQQCPNRWGLA